MEERSQPQATGNEVELLEGWLGSALAIGRSHLGLSLKDACRTLASVSDKTLMKWESGDRLQPLTYAIELARRDSVTRRMLLQAIQDGEDRSAAHGSGSTDDGPRDGGAASGSLDLFVT
jgi:hypothetical protein